MTSRIEIRDERPEDIGAIRDLNERAFGQALEADLVDTLRSNGGVLLSLVAVAGDRLVGHILYSPASLEGKLHGAGLGPMAVHPDFQRKGIGSRLVEEGNRRMEEAGLPFIIVLGHADFYPRFGFRPAARQGVSCDWDVPDDAFMLLIIDEERMHGVTGRAKYREEFSVA